MTWSRIGVLGLVALLVAIGGCGQDAAPEGAPLGAVHLDGERWLGEAISVDNLVVWPVYTTRPLDLGEFVTLEEGEAQGTARVTEVQGAGGSARQHAQVVVILNDLAQEDVPHEPPGAAGETAPTETPAEDGEAPGEPEGGSHEDAAQVLNGLGRAAAPAGQQRGQVAMIEGGGATVGTLVIENDGDLPILVVAGTIVKGGQQDRQIAQDLVIAAHSKVPVEAFCVEPGRWNARAGQDGIALAQTGLGIAVKSLRVAQYEKSQQAVWDEVRVVLEKKGIQGTSTFVAAVEEDDVEARTRRTEIELQICDRFEALAATSRKPVGFAYAVNGDIQSVRAFAHPRLLADHLPAFVQAMALEADLGQDGPAKEVSAKDVAAFVAAVNDAEESFEETAGLNSLGVRANDHGFNGNCYLTPSEDGQERQAVTVDWTKK